jgi:protein SCO1/2
VKIPARVVAIFIIPMMVIPGCLSNTEIDDYYGDDINPPLAFQSFELVDQNNNSFSSESFAGKVVVIAFLFTNCPDICPIVSANLAYIAKELGTDYGTEVEILTITVDPWRDTWETLADYSEGRNLNWTHLTSNTIDENDQYPELEAVWGDFGVGLSVVEANGTSARHHPAAYEVDHSTGTIIIDRSGNQRIWWGDLDWAPELVLQDIRALM